MLLLKKLWYYVLMDRPIPGWDHHWGGHCKGCDDDSTFISKHGGKIGHCLQCGHEKPMLWSEYMDQEGSRRRSEDTLRRVRWTYGWHKLPESEKLKTFREQPPLLIRAWHHAVKFLRDYEIIQ